MSSQPDQVADELLALLSAHQDYIGEGVSQLEHATQCAQLAADAGADHETVLAALLHDIGHLCAPDDAARMEGVGVVAHEDIGARWLLERGFPERVADLVSGHVAAKRYLTATNPDYRDRLSPASQVTLRHQGGAMTPAEAAVFEQDPRFKEKLRLRVWDEQAKRQGWEVRPLETYRELILASVR